MEWMERILRINLCTPGNYATGRRRKRHRRPTHRHGKMGDLQEKIYQQNY
jgi:hypothetical protein